MVRLLWEAARWQMVAAVGLSVVLSLTEGVSLAAIFPLVALLGGTGSPGPRTAWVFGVLMAMGVPRGAWLVTVLVGLVIVVGLLAQLNGVLGALENRVMLLVQERLALRVYGGILAADWAFLVRQRASDLTHALTNEVQRVGILTANVLAVLANGCVAVLVLGVAAWLSPWLTLVVGVCFGALVPLQRRARRRTQAGGEELSARTRAVFEAAGERLGHLKAIKAYGAGAAETGLFGARYGAVSAATMANLWRRNMVVRRFQLVSLGLLCGVLVVGLQGLHLGAGAMLVFLVAFMRVLPRLNQLQTSAHAIAVDLPALRGLEGLLADCGSSVEGHAAAPELRREVRLAGVRFGYGERVVLAGVDLTIGAGKITGLAGVSGAGKSTVADLVMGLIFADAGSVTVDGVALTRENAAAWRRRVGYVSQDTLLFHASVRENLLWARPGVGEDEIREAIGKARAGFVWELEDGLETVVGDRGVMLSHGQRQRLALARAFLLEPSLLILDEATNALDGENEEGVLRAVRDAGVAVLLVSHRGSALRGADVVYVLGEGRVVGVGDWEAVRALVG